jgi:hypothetical protein
MTTTSPRPKSADFGSQLSTMNTQLPPVQIKELVDFEEELAGDEELTGLKSFPSLVGMESGFPESEVFYCFLKLRQALIIDLSNLGVVNQHIEPTIMDGGVECLHDFGPV